MLYSILQLISKIYSALTYEGGHYQTVLYTWYQTSFYDKQGVLNVKATIVPLSKINLEDCISKCVTVKRQYMCVSDKIDAQFFSYHFKLKYIYLSTYPFIASILFKIM